MNTTASIVDRIESADGTIIAVERSGSGPNLVIVNGALSDRRAAARLRPYLDDALTVIAYDRRGRGDSADQPGYAPEREMDDLAAVLEAAGGRGFVFGQSSGAILALEAAVGGLGIDRLVLNEPPFIVDDSRRRPSPDLPARLARLVDAGDREAALHLFLTNAAGMTDEVIAAMRSTEVWPTMIGLAATAAYDATLVGDSQLPTADRLAAFGTATLVTCGDATAPWIRRGTSALVERLPNARLELLPGQAHSPAPDVLAKALLGFLAG
jgi:pimeloyl-ACP methyl ester carboxylesterase